MLKQIKESNLGQTFLHAVCWCFCLFVCFAGLVGFALVVLFCLFIFRAVTYLTGKIILQINTVPPHTMQRHLGTISHLEKSTHSLKEDECEGV